MTDWPKVPPDPPAIPPSGLPSQAAALIALVTALGGIVASWRGYEGGQDTTRAAYEALRVRTEQQARQLEDVVRAQTEMRDWMSEASRKLDERTSNTERVLRKVAKPKQVAPPLLPAEPAPPTAPPPPSAEVRPSVPLPPFDALPK